MIHSYNDMQVVTKWATPNPGKEIREALTNTMADVSMLTDEPEVKVSSKML